MKRVFCAVGGGFLSGAFLASLLAVSGQTVLAAVCLLLCLLIAVFYRVRGRAACVVFLVFMSLSAGLFAYKTYAEYQPVVSLADTEATFTAKVLDWERRANGRYTYELQIESIDAPVEQPFRFLLYTNRSLQADWYDTVTMRAKFYLPSSTDSFDGIRYYKSRNIFLLASQNFAEEAEVTVSSPAQKPLGYDLKALNRMLCAKLDERMPAEAAAAVKGMVLGDTDDLDFALQQMYINTGTIHLFSISGTHVAILSGVLFLLLRKVPDKIKIPLILGVILLFILLSGAHASAVRSGLMLALLLAGRLAHREADAVNSLFFAGFLIVFFDVYAIMDIGFCMSFLATLGVVVLAPRMHRFLLVQWGVENRTVSQILSAVCVSLSATLFLLPVFVFTFHTLSVISPFVNLVVGLLVTPVLGLGFVCVLLCSFPVPNLLFEVESALILLQNAIVRFFGELRFASIGLDYREFRLWFVMAAGLLALGLLWYKKQKAVLRWSAGLCALLFLVSSVLVFAGQYDCVMLYTIGDGTAANVIFLCNSHATVIAAADDDYIDKQTVTFLKGKGVTQVDNLLIAYPTFSKYEDTSALIRSLNIQNVFYNKNNTICKDLLTNLVSEDRLLPLEEGMRLSVDGMVSLEPSYVRTNLNLDIACYDTRIYFGDAAHTKESSAGTLQLLRGDVDSTSKLSALSLVLQRPSDDDLAGDFLPAWKQNLAFQIRDRHPVTLIQRKEI